MTKPPRNKTGTQQMTLEMILNRFQTEARLNELKKEHDPDCERETESNRTEKQRKEDERAYIEQRLREIALWERRISDPLKRHS